MHDDMRDSTPLGTVTDYLINVIATPGEITGVVCIEKNIREETLQRKCSQPWRCSPLWLFCSCIAVSTVCPKGEKYAIS